MKKILKLLISILIIAFIIITFMFSIKNLNTEEIEDNTPKDIKEELTINKLKLQVNYLKGNEVNAELTYGNISSKEIKIINENKEKVSFAIYLNDLEASNEQITYDILYKLKEESSYENISKNNILKDNVLLYNITIDEEQELYLKIEFKANKENDTTNLKGILKIDNNVSETELFNQDIRKIQGKIDDKIASLNGISESGYYTLNIKDYIDEDTKDFKGVVFIDANDISNPKFYYFIYNSRLMINDYLYKRETIKKSDIKSIDSKIVSNINEKNACKSHTSKECLPFNSLKYNAKGDRKAFSTDVENVIEIAKEKHNYTDKRVYVYDIKEDFNITSNLRGYILIDNSESKNEYYLYITNDLYMVSGYNVTKYGMFKDNSTTIRAYNETSYKLSSESKKKVCKFTGFTSCYDSTNKKI